MKTPVHTCQANTAPKKACHAWVMISSLRRNLQREHLERLIDLTLPGNGSSAAYKAISNLCVMELGELKERIAKVLDGDKVKLDPYSKAHLFEARQRIEKALDADYVYNQAAPASAGLPFLLFGAPADSQDDSQK